MTAGFAMKHLPLLFAIVALCAGCISRTQRMRSCAMMLLIDGKHIHPSASQFAAVERKLERQFAARNLSLVHGFGDADLIATIECIEQPGTPEFTDLIVRDIAPNTFQPRTAASSYRDMPSLREAEREHQRVLQNR